MTQYLDTWSRKRSVGELSFLQRLQIKLLPKEQTLISGLDPAQMALMVDISHWNGDCDITLMRRDGKVSAVLPKASDGFQVVNGDPYDLETYKDDWLDRNIQKAYDAGIPCIPYHYVQFNYANFTIQSIIDWNFARLKNALKNKIPGKSFHGIVLDVEQKDTTSPNAATIVLGLIRCIQADPQLGAVPLIIYSSMSVLNYYPALRDQLSYQGTNYNLWMAQWVFNTVTNTTWANLWSSIIPRIDMRVLTPGFATWWAVQWTGDRFTLPGCNGAIDLNSYKGTEAQLYGWLGYQQQQPQPPQPPEPPAPPPADTVSRAEFDALVARFEAHTHQTGTAQ